jgi:anti-sigma B factor antagonist
MIIVDRRRIGDVLVLDCSGRITLGEASSNLREVLRSAVLVDKKLVVNLASVSYIDNSGMGELVSGFTHVKNSGGLMKLCGMSGRVKDLLQITKLYTVFDVYEDVDAAVQSFSR